MAKLNDTQINGDLKVTGAVRGPDIRGTSIDINGQRYVLSTSTVGGSGLTLVFTKVGN